MGLIAQTTGAGAPASDLEQLSVEDAQELLPNSLIAAVVLVAWALLRVSARPIAGRKLRRSRSTRTGTPTAALLEPRGSSAAGARCPRRR